jgi:chromosome partitioning protein
MPVVAIVNRKGGSGKSTLATHLAAYCAKLNLAVMLGDVDRQQSAQTWLRLRQAHAPVNGSTEGRAIGGWAVDARNVFRAPAGTTHVILDTPGGLHGLELARVVVNCDAILMPVCASVFDRESAAQCLAELRTLPRVTSGRCRIGAVGMRVDSGCAAHTKLRDWAQRQDLPLVSSLRTTSRYSDWAEDGLTLFDLPAPDLQNELADWQPILDWLAPVLGTASAAPVPGAERHRVPPRAERPALKVVSRLASIGAAAVAPASAPSEPNKPSKLRGVLESLPIPRFLQRGTS